MQAVSFLDFYPGVLSLLDPLHESATDDNTDPPIAHCLHPPSISPHEKWNCRLSETKTRQIGNVRRSGREEKRKGYGGRAQRKERLSESDGQGERHCLTIRKGYGNIPVCVFFHPDPVASTGAYRVTSS